VGVGEGATLGVGAGDAGGAALALALGLGDALGDAFELGLALGVGPGDEDEGDVLGLVIGSGFDVPL
jgi:hypothetical protein